MKTAIVFASLTGNTEAMAEVLAGELNGKAEADVFDVSAQSFDNPDAYDAIAFGSPAMGEEVLEEDSFEPMFSAIESSLKGKRVALFGSYGWGDGQWMRDWEDRCAAEVDERLGGPVCGRWCHCRWDSYCNGCPR